MKYKYKTPEEKGRPPYFDQNYGVEFNMQRLDFMFDQLRLVYQDLPSKFFNEKNIYHAFDMLRGHLYSISLENRFNLTNAQIKRLRKPCTLSHVESFSNFISKEYAYVVPHESELLYKKASRVPRYSFTIMDPTVHDNYLELAFKNNEYTYAVGDYIIMYVKAVTSILEDIEYDAPTFNKMMTELYAYGISTRSKAKSTMLPMAVMSKNQEYIDRAMYIIGKDSYIKTLGGYNYSNIDLLIPMGKSQSGYAQIHHEATLREEINNYYGAERLESFSSDK